MKERKKMKVFGFIISMIVSMVAGYLICHYEVFRMVADYFVNVVGPAIGIN